MDKIEIGLELHGAWWGRGLATEGALTALRFGFEQNGLERIISVTAADHIAARRVMEKAGLTYQGTRYWMNPNVPVVWYAIDRLAWAVTLGPALDSAQFTAPPNVRFETFVPHSAVLPHVRAMVTQCGLGTLTKALAYGVPLVCIPLVGDQPDNAARVVAHGTGIRLGRNAAPEEIGAAIERVLTRPEFGERARRLAGVLTKENGAQAAAEEIESVIQRAANAWRR